MACLIVASTRPYAGKSGVVAALLLEAAERGVKAAYFKPLGTAPVSSAGATTDRDAAYLSGLASAEVPLDSVCPVVLTQGLIQAALAGGNESLVPTVADAYREVSLKADVVFVEGPSDLTQGRAFGLDLKSLSDLLCCRVLLVDRLSDAGIPEGVLLARDTLGDTLMGVILNDVGAQYARAVAETVVPYLGAQRVRVLGILEHDATLSSVTVADIVSELDGRVLSAAGALEQPVESFMVGAMGHEKALRYFRMRDRKAVVTGGDRADVQLAALETDTRAIVVTGGTVPSAIVLARADEMKVPIVLVDVDTLTAVERLEETFGRVRVHDAGKVARIREMLRAAVDIDEIFSVLFAQAS